MRSEAEIQSIVYESIAATFRFPIDRVGPATTASDIDGWDSVSTSRLFFAIEDRVGVELPIEDMLTAKNVSELISVVLRFINGEGR